MRLVALPQLKAGMVLAQNVYASATSPVVFLRSGVTLTQSLIARLAARKVDKVYVEDTFPAATLTPGDITRTRVVPAAPTVQPRLRTEALQSLERSFSNITIDDNGIHGDSVSVNDVTSVVGRLVGSLLVGRKTMLNIQSLKSYDDSTYHHSLSVAVLAIGIGQQLGLSTRELNRLGLAAIMHDIGKMAVPITVIQKPDRLNDGEFAIVKTHSRAGSVYLSDAALGDEALWQAVLFHHERVDGNGYPAGIMGERIPLFSRIISVADVYDALTSHRPHRNPLQPADSLEYVMGGVGSAFDYDVVRALTQRLAPYPVGSCVELSSRQLAVVLDTENPLRPIVEIAGEGLVVDLTRDRQYLSVVVTRMLPEIEWQRILSEGLPVY